MSDNKHNRLTWEAFQSLGNPLNAPEPNETVDKKSPSKKIALKVHYEKKGRGGKEAVIIRGFETNSDHDLDQICKTIKAKIGIGGSVKEGEIILQGNQRDRIVRCLADLGFANVKKAGG
ncbi:MAG: translation initiation factor [Saprospiraceae bacterium]|nr:translation initiation factor [Saprospiraceae bacterium]